MACLCRKAQAVRKRRFTSSLMERASRAGEESFRLFNQEYWDIDSLDFSGGRIFGIFISGDKGILHHIRLKNWTCMTFSAAR
jgi:hypothetical protein